MMFATFATLILLKMPNANKRIYLKILKHVTMHSLKVTGFSSEASALSRFAS